MTAAGRAYVCFDSVTGCNFEAICDWTACGLLHMLACNGVGQDQTGLADSNFL